MSWYFYNFLEFTTRYIIKVVDAFLTILMIPFSISCSVLKRPGQKINASDYNKKKEEKSARFFELAQKLDWNDTQSALEFQTHIST